MGKKIKIILMAMTGPQTSKNEEQKPKCSELRAFADAQKC